MRAPTPAAIVAGIGNMYRGDDGVGPVVAARLAPHMPSRVRLLAGMDDPLELIDAWDGADLAIVVDAVVSGAEAGTIHELDATTALPAMFSRLSTHVFSVAQVIELGRLLGRMPRRLIVIGVEATDMTQGRMELTPAVAGAVDHVVARVRALVDVDGLAAASGANGA